MKRLGRVQAIGIPALGATGDTAAPATRAASGDAGRILGDAVPLQDRLRLDPRLYQIAVLASLLVS